jgi:hypothetical protein
LPAPTGTLHTSIDFQILEAIYRKPGGIGSSSLQADAREFQELLLPMLSDIHYADFCQSFFIIADAFTTACPELVEPTYFAVIRRIPKQRAQKVGLFIDLILMLIPKLDPVLVDRECARILMTCARAASLGQIDVAQMGARAFNMVELEPTMIDSARVLFPRLLPVVTSAMDAAWTPKIRYACEAILGYLERIDSVACAEAQRKAKAALDERSLESRTWSQIGRKAAANDSTIDLGKFLGSLQTAYQRRPLGVRFTIGRQPGASAAAALPAGRNSGWRPTGNSGGVKPSGTQPQRPPSQLQLQPQVVANRPGLLRPVVGGGHW